MTNFDYFIIATLAISAVISLFRGFLKEVISVGSWLLGVWAAFTFADKLSPKIVTYIPFIDDLPLGKSIIVQTLISGAIIFFGIIAIGSIINFILTKAVQKTGLSASDRFLGMIFGLARGGLIVALITLFIANNSVAQKEQWWINSQLRPHAEKAANILQSLIPEDFKSYLPGDGETPIGDTEKNQSLDAPAIQDGLQDAIAVVTDESEIIDETIEETLSPEESETP